MNNLSDAMKLKLYSFAAQNYTPHATQVQFHRSEARFRLWVSGRRSGKSLAVSQEALAEARLDNRLIWLCAPTFELASRTFNMVWAAVNKEGLVCRRKSQRDMFIEFANGSTIKAMSTESADNLRGAGVNLVICDEMAAMPRVAYEECLLPTILDTNGRLAGITTPQGRNWTYDLFIKNAENPDWQILQTPSSCNPYLKTEDIQKLRENMSQRAAEQELDATFTATGDVVFQEFKEALHVRPFDRSKSGGGSFIAGLDFGFRNDSALIIAHLQRGFVHILDEVIKPGLTAEALAGVINEKRARYNIRHVYGDPSGDNKSQIGGTSIIQELRRHGVHVEYSTRPEDRSVSGGIERVRRYFLDARGETKLLVSPSCTRVISDLLSYRYAPATDGKPETEAPIKGGAGASDHSVDAIRYMLSGIESAARSSMGFTRFVSDGFGGQMAVTIGEDAEGPYLTIGTLDRKYRGNSYYSYAKQYGIIQ